MLAAIRARLEGSLGGERLRRLHRATVAVVGAGLLGGQILQHLAMLQIRTLLVDVGRVDLPNLGNQMLPAAALGEPKARVRAAQMHQLNPTCAVRAFDARVEDLGLGVFAGCDLILTGLDGRSSRLAVNQIAARLGIDWIDAAVDGSGDRLYGTVSWFQPHRSDVACYGCGFDGERLAAIAAEEHGAGCLSWRSAAAPQTPPTLAASPFGAVVAGLQTSWALDALLGDDAGGSRVGRQLQIAGAGVPRIRAVTLARSAGCASPHARVEGLRRVDSPGPAALLARAAVDIGAPPDALLFPDRSLVHGLVCADCARERPLVKRRESVSDSDIRCDCGGATGMFPRALRDRLDAAEVHRLGSLDWSALGIPAEDWVSVRAAGRPDTHYLLPREMKEGT